MKTQTYLQTKSSIRQLILLLVVSTISLAWLPAQAAGTGVSAVLFYSPSCGHCQKVITEVLPPIQEKFGERLTILGVDVTFAEGQDLYQAAIQHFQIPADRVGVPTLIVGSTILVGSVEIPEKFEQIVDSGLQNGGIDWPAVPGLQEQLAALDTSLNQTVSIASQVSGPPELQTPDDAESDSPQPMWIQKFMRDPLANSVAVVLLVIMVIAAIASVLLVLKPLPAGSQPDSRAWIIPVLVLIGIFIASYMTYVEVTKSDAICGPVGDCNAVQQSSYATLFGVLPVGIFGLLGYMAIGAAWLLRRFGPSSFNNITGLAMWGMALFGVVFSIYLTFLEPFVIGATCIWCISSAVVITLLLGVSTNFARTIDDYEEAGLEALNEAEL